MTLAYDISGLSVLIVEDNKHMQFLLKEILRAFNVRRVRTASDGADALKEIRVFAADMIITDWAMEPLDGIDLTRLLRTGSDSKNPYVPIIMLTGHTSHARVVEARDSGIHEFLAKPISAQMLYQRIVSVIENARPFVKHRSYTGPCRRRAKGADFGGKERRGGQGVMVKEEASAS